MKSHSSKIIFLVTLKTMAPHYTFDMWLRDPERDWDLAVFRSNFTILFLLMKAGLDHDTAKLILDIKNNIEFEEYIIEFDEEYNGEYGRVLW